ncbi:xanthine dehydrogenase family protein molybdopterin-binding subunit [Phenylobacterium sp.]|jgi:isoquinoline 1-oxidoreductase beta subunit|uniref:xanthine dehydrogenase family protein molybdopterin-binding subunit n=1 Tax=Phenylobacterium sp. TaxID=1871053 RepID=UPI002F3EC3BB
MPPGARDRADHAPRDGDLSRRAMLHVTVAAGGGLLLGIGLHAPTAASADEDGQAFVPNAFIRVATDGHVTIITPAIEMGQGTRTSIGAILAEELDVGMDNVTVEDAPPDQKKYGNPLFGIQMTGASSTTRAWYTPLRRAGASARAMLVTAAARGWGVDPASCRTADGVVHHDPSGRSAPYGALAGRAAGIPPPAEPALKDPKDFKLIGRSLHRLDAPDKASGKAMFGIDVMRPGMKFATLASSPTFGGKVLRVDDSAARGVPGVRQIVVLDDLVAVVGDHYWAAKQGLDSLVVEWGPGPNAKVRQADIWSALERDSTGRGVVVTQTGDAAGRLREGEVFEATYELPFLAHAAMEPMNCTLHATPGRCEIWVGTQVPGKAQGGAAAVLGLKPEQVVVNNHLIGGGFGRRLEADGVITAARIAQHVDGPVKVVWSREEDIQQALYRPVYHDRLRARVANGKLLAWHHRLTGSSILSRWLPPAVKDGIDADAVDALEPPYDVPHLLTEYVRSEPPAVPTCFWRGVGPNSNVFSRECFIDLIAHRTGVDPVAFRRGMLAKTPRVLGVLELAAAKAGWGAPAVAAAGRTGRGVAVLAGFGSFVAAVADVAVADDGDVAVTRLVIAADVGTVISPDTVAAQAQGGAVFGLGALLHGRITVADGKVEQSNFHDYRVVRIDEMPTIEVHLLHSAEAPGGIGEPPTVVVQPAVANAIFAATGVQLTRMPIDRSLIARKKT